MDLSFKKFTLVSARRKTLYIWIRHYKVLFVIFFLFTSGVVGYQWYRDLYGYSWSDEERRAYIESTAKETVFQEKKFLEALKSVEQAAESHKDLVVPGRDLFAGARKKN